MHVRRATPADLDDLLEFTIRQLQEGEGAIKGREVVRRGIEQALEDESLTLYWVLLGDGAEEPAGCAAAVKQWSDWNAGFYWWLQSMFIAPAHRGKGGMKMLVDEIREEMHRQDGIQLRLYVNKDNKQAKSAYERCNFSHSVYEIMMLIEDDEQ